MSLFAVFDVETTGLYPDRGDRIVEISAVVLDEQFNVVRLFDSLINPGRKIPADSTAIHQISDNDIREAPSFSELLPDLHDCFKGVTHLVAHNLPFDLGFLKAAFRKSGEPFPDGLRTICTLQNAKKYGIGSEDNRYKLPMVAAALQIPVIGEAHQAVIDAGVTARIFSMLYEVPFDENQRNSHWPLPNNRITSSRQRPRQDISVSLQRLAKLGLSVRTTNEGYFSDDMLKSIANVSGNEQFAVQHNHGLSPEAIRELKANIKLSEAIDLGVKRPHAEMNDTSSLTWYLFTQQKKDIASIAKERSITESTVYSHLEQAVRYRLIEISCLATPAQIQRVAEARAGLPNNETKLKPLFEALNEEFSYGLLKCVTTWLDRGE